MIRTNLLSMLLAGSLTFAQATEKLVWNPLPPIPDSLGVAGPFTGVHGNLLLVAGGANFPSPVWESDKIWHSAVYSLSLDEEGAKWRTVGQLPRRLGYGACVSVPEGVVCLGGNDSDRVYDDVFLLSWNGGSLSIDESLPSLPAPLCYSAAATIGSHIYVAGGQSGLGLESARKILWRLDWTKRGDDTAFVWEELEAWPGDARAFNTLVAQSNGVAECFYLMGGRHLAKDGEVEFLNDVYEYNPQRPAGAWRRCTNIPTTLAAGTATAAGARHVFLLAGADGSLFEKSDVLKDDHPGFPKSVWGFDTAADEWKKVGEMPQNQVTTHAVKWRGSILLASGEVRPRVRTPAVWRIVTKP